MRLSGPLIGGVDMYESRSLEPFYELNWVGGAICRALLLTYRMLLDEWLPLVPTISEDG